MEPTPLPAHALPILHLSKGIIYRHQDEIWRRLQHHLGDIKRHFATIGLEVFVDEAEGYALLRQLPYPDEQANWPKLSEKRPLSYPVTLLSILLRKRLLEADAQDGSAGVVVSGVELKEQLAVFLPATGTDETKLTRQMDTYLNQLTDLRFLRKLTGEDDRYEISRVLSAYIKLEDMEAILEKLRQHYAVWDKGKEG
jgi:hypothetical protein